MFRKHSITDRNAFPRRGERIYGYNGVAASISSLKDISVRTSLLLKRSSLWWLYANQKNYVRPKPDHRKRANSSERNKTPQKARRPRERSQKILDGLFLTTKLLVWPPCSGTTKILSEYRQCLSGLSRVSNGVLPEYKSPLKPTWRDVILYCSSHVHMS